jgi:hypothetical protein
MAIVQKRTPPANGSDAIGRALRDLAGPPDPKDTLGGAAIDLSKPLPVYRLGLDAIRQAGPDSLKQATRVGWRYLLERGERAGYADVKESAGGQARFSSVSRSRNADRLIAAAHVAQRIGEQLLAAGLHPLSASGASGRPAGKHRG